MASSKRDNKLVELVFARPKRDMEMYFPKTKGEDFFKIFTTDINKVGEWFNQYQMESLELTINSILDTEETTRLLVGSAEGNVMKVVLKPKPKTTNSSNQTTPGPERVIKGDV